MSIKNQIKNIAEIMGVEFNGDMKDGRQYLKTLNLKVDNKKDIVKLLKLMKECVGDYHYFDLILKMAPVNSEDLIEFTPKESFYYKKDDLEQVENYNGDLIKKTSTKTNRIALFKNYMVMRNDNGMEKIYYDDIETLSVAGAYTNLLNFTKPQLQFLKAHENLLAGVFD